MGTSLTLDELKQRLAAKYTEPELLLEVLGLSDPEALLEVLSDYIEENQDRLTEEVKDDFTQYPEEDSLD